MPTDNVGAYQEICARVRTIVAGANFAAIVGYSPELRYADVNYAKLPAGDKLWMKVTMAEAKEQRRTLGSVARVTYSGLVGVQLFVPTTDLQAAERIRKCGEALKAAFTSSTASVNFYKAGIKSMPPDPPWFYARVYATFQYDQMQGQ